MAATLTAEDFAPLIGKQVTAQGHAGALSLVSVNQHAQPASADLPRSPFTLIFTGPAEPILPEGLHEVTFEDGPAFLIYISPIFTPARTTQDYQAVFN